MCQGELVFDESASATGNGRIEEVNWVHKSNQMADLTLWAPPQCATLTTRNAAGSSLRRAEQASHWHTTSVYVAVACCRSPSPVVAAVESAALRRPPTAVFVLASSSSGVEVAVSSTCSLWRQSCRMLLSVCALNERTELETAEETTSVSMRQCRCSDGTTVTSVPSCTALNRVHILEAEWMSAVTSNIPNATVCQRHSADWQRALTRWSCSNEHKVKASTNTRH
jgi:hypothetical protein